MNYTIDSLMKEVGCERFPERWRSIFESAMQEYDVGGSIYSDGEYYRQINEKYNILDGMLDVYKSAAEDIKKNEALDRLLYLICYALRERRYAHSDLSAYTTPKAKCDKDRLAYDMLCALAMVSLADHCYDIMKKRSIPEEHVKVMMNKLTASVRSSLQKTGNPTLSLFEWNQHYADAKIYRIGRLEFHFGDSFGGAVSIFENKNGEHVALADGLTVDESGYALGAYAHENQNTASTRTVSEDELAYIGYPYDDKGYVASATVKLPKSEWTKIVTRESPALKLHIPADGKLTPELVDLSLRDGMEFAKKYFPDFDYRIFSCYSWLCDPQLAEILDNDCNIVKFSKRFHPLSIPSKGRSVFNFVYRISDPGTDYALLPERTSLERALKKHYTDGKVIYEMRGYFFK